MARIALITERRYERPAEPVDEYVGNIVQEDAILTEALARQGICATRVDWARRDVDWASFDALVLRTMWDYFDRFAEFSGWLAHIDGRVPVFNELSTVRWNMDKHYLRDLAAAGLPIVPTRWFEVGDAPALADVLADTGWAEVVIKPAVSGAARHTYRLDASTAADHDAIFAERLRTEAMLVQPFMRDIVARGEVTVVSMDGQCTHALRKVAKPGDFRVQDDHGGTLEPHQARDDELQLARAAMAVVDPLPLYGRVDMVRDDDGALAIMELELIEPELWIRREPACADVLAAGLRRRL
jgi:glutathione synthase/RimK-type ligase-like ATP-grasp enzyme